MAPVHALPHLLHIIVYDNHRVVNDHSECYYQSCKRYGVQFHTEDKEQAYGGKYRYRYRHGRNFRHTARHQQYNNNNNGNDRNQKFPEEVLHRIGNHLALICYYINMYVCRKTLFILIKGSPHLFSHLHDIVSRSHFHGQEDAFHPIIRDVFIKARILSFYLCHIFQPYNISLRGGINDLVCYVILAVVCV